MTQFAASTLRGIDRVTSSRSRRSTPLHFHFHGFLKVVITSSSLSLHQAKCRKSDI
jgi:hypothetical protein